MIIGATGSIGQRVRKTLLEKTDWDLTLFSRNVGRLALNSEQEKAVAGDVMCLLDDGECFGKS